VFQAPPLRESSRLASVKATSSSSTRSFIMRVSHPSRFSSLCNLARKAARAANSAGMCKDAGFALTTRTGGSQAESSPALGFDNSVNFRF
jgi:hypothetical protein